MARSGEGETFAVLGPPGVKPVVNSIFDFSADALAQLRLWLEQNPPAIGISNILGFSQFSATSSVVGTGGTETTSSTSYVDLATTGPTITGLSDGQYVVVYGAGMSISTAGNFATMSVQINAATATDADGCATASGVLVPGARAIIVSLANGNNTLAAKYRVGVGTDTGTFIRRWMIALRYANK